MTAISLWQLDIVAAFLEKSRDYLDIEHTIRLHWPIASSKPRCGDAARAGKAKPGRRAKAPAASETCRTGA